jgi:NAD(P)-dependent dehydrogenase (short-subunit alcohol dehydrogenase family)
MDLTLEDPILRLASDEASFVTGSVLMVDGGQFTD